MTKKSILYLLIILCMGISACGTKGGTEKEESAAEKNDTLKEGDILEAGETLEGSGDSKKDEELQMFPWQGRTISLVYALDNEMVKNGSQEAEGKYIQIFLECQDGTLTWDQVTGEYRDFIIRDSAGIEYPALATGFTTQTGQNIDVKELENAEYSGMSPIFDIPEEAMLDDLVLLVQTEDENEKIILKISDIPHEAPEDEGEEGSEAL